MIKFTFGYNFVVLLFLSICNSNEEMQDVTKHEAIINMLTSWFADAEDIKDGLTLQFEDTLTNSSMLRDTYYNNLYELKKKNTDNVIQWMRQHCANCEMEKFNDTITETCFNKDKIIGREKRKFNSYLYCVYNTTLNFKDAVDDMKSYFKKFNVIKEKLAINNFTSDEEDYKHIIESTYKWMQILSELIFKASELLEDLSMGQQHRIKRFLTPLPPTRSPYRNIEYYETFYQFALKCFNTNEYTYTDKIDFQPFRRCVVQNVCSNTLYDMYITDES